MFDTNTTRNTPIPQGTCARGRARGGGGGGAFLFSGSSTGQPCLMCSQLVTSITATTMSKLRDPLHDARTRQRRGRPATITSEARGWDGATRSASSTTRISTSASSRAGGLNFGAR